MSAQRAIGFTLNGVRVTANVAASWRHRTTPGAICLTGAREACGQGLCGCCTVLVNGRAVSGCLYLASFIDGADVATIEGFSVSNRLSPVQEAFIEAGAFQCGYCTSGFIITATQLLDEYPDPTDDEIKHYLTGNLCRCAAYPEILDAVRLAVKKRNAGATT